MVLMNTILWRHLGGDRCLKEGVHNGTLEQVALIYCRIQDVLTEVIIYVSFTCLLNVSSLTA